MQTILGCTPMWNQITTRQTAFPVISKLWKAKLWKDCKLLFFFCKFKAVWNSKNSFKKLKQIHKKGLQIQLKCVILMKNIVCSAYIFNLLQ